MKYSELLWAGCVGLAIGGHLQAALTCIVGAIVCRCIERAIATVQDRAMMIASALNDAKSRGTL